MGKIERKDEKEKRKSEHKQEYEYLSADKILILILFSIKPNEIYSRKVRM
jgi:hypothetical protein